MALGLPQEEGGDCRPFNVTDAEGRSFRIYLWTCTPDRSAEGRPQGEYKIQLILPGQQSRERGDFDFNGAYVVLLGYCPDAGVFVAWDASLHRNFSNSKNVQVPSSP